MRKDHETTSVETVVPAAIGREGERAKAKELREAEQSARDQFYDEERTLQVNPDATTTLTGKRIYRHNIHAGSHWHQNHKISNLFTNLMLGGLSLQAFGQIAGKVLSFASAFGTATSGAPDKGKTKTYEDDYNIYDTEKVTERAYRSLQTEARMIAEREAALASIDDPALRMAALQELAETANALDMRPHPVTGDFVHCIERVQRIEAELTAESALVEPALHSVPVFRPRLAMAGHDGKGVNVLPEYDDDATVETLGAPEEKAPPRPIIPLPAPSLKG